MNLQTTVELYAYGTPEGACKRHKTMGHKTGPGCGGSGDAELQDALHNIYIGSMPLAQAIREDWADDEDAMAVFSKNPKERMMGWAYVKANLYTDDGGTIGEVVESGKSEKGNALHPRKRRGR